jgi:integrase
MKAGFTSVFIEGPKPHPDRQLDHWDSKVSGLGLRVSPGGRKTWVLMYRHLARKRRLTLGTYPPLSLADARNAARTQLAKVQMGHDPAAIKHEAHAADTFSALADRYILEHAVPKKKPRSVAEDRKILKRDLLPAWGSRKAGEIRRRDVIALVDAVAARGARIQANRTLALISTIFNFGVAKEVVEVNPAYRVPKPGLERQRDRVLNESEIHRLWDALDMERPIIAAIFKLALLTSQRFGEVCGMTWDEVDLESGWWTIKAERAKNNLAHRVPLGGVALSILRDLGTQRLGAVFVFPGRRNGQPLGNLQKPMKRLKTRTGIDFKFHDLRRTAASHMTGLGIPRLVVSKILNHVESGITAVYDRHGYDAEKRSALEKWEGHLLEIVNQVAENASGVLRNLY